MGNLEKSTTVVNLKAPPMYKVFVVQLSISVSIAIIANFTMSNVAGYSALIGGLISTFSNAYFARKAFRYRGARYTPQIVKSFYAGQSGKMTMTVVMFALVFAGIKPLNELMVIVSFTLTIIAGLIATAYIGLKVVK